MTLTLPPQLSEILRCKLEDLTEGHLNRLIALREDEDLDFKSELYGRRDRDSQELVSDIASFSNTRGGLLVIGIEEKAGVATQLTTIQLTTIEEDLRLRQVGGASKNQRPIPELLSTVFLTSPRLARVSVVSFGSSRE